MSLNKEFAEMVQEQNRKFRLVHPLICGMEFNPYVNRKSRWTDELSLLQNMAKEQAWQNLPPLLEPLHNPDTAIIITDALQKIKWVNNGFFKMTGYRPEEVLGRHPKMLQGSETAAKDIDFIRQAIRKAEPFSTEILNYRKNGEAYTCQVEIFPLRNDKNILVNFIAIENESRQLLSY